MITQANGARYGVDGVCLFVCLLATSLKIGFADFCDIVQIGPNCFNSTKMEKQRIFAWLYGCRLLLQYLVPFTETELHYSA